MSKTIWNPLNPDMSSQDYERHVGSVIERQINAPGALKSLFQHLLGNRETIESLDGLHLARRTSEKPHWEGASGYEHQIDESFSTKDEEIIVLVECRHWSEGIDIPAFSTFLIRVIDIAMKDSNKIVVGILATTQGPQGRFGGREEDQDCIAKLQTHFGSIGYPISIQWLPD